MENNPHLLFVQKNFHTVLCKVTPETAVQYVCQLLEKHPGFGWLGDRFELLSQRKGDWVDAAYYFLERFNVSGCDHYDQKFRNTLTLSG
jgi:hypothetical protein